MATSPASTDDFETHCFSSCGGGNGRVQLPRKKLIKGVRKLSTLSTTLSNTKDDAMDDAISDAALAKEMNELSVAERERIYEEIHGVAKEQDETPDFVASCLARLDACIADLYSAKRKDLDRALFLKPSLANDQKFKLMFLRCDNYDAPKAAERMARFFSQKRDLFGDDKLVKKITLDDLDELVVELAKAGGMSFQLPTPDRTGRPVLFIGASRPMLQNNKNLHQYDFHNIMGIISDNEKAQKKGVVFIVYAPSSAFQSRRHATPSEAMANFHKIAQVLNSLPIRISSCHWCYDNPLSQIFIALVRAGMGKDFRLRLRTHFGSSTEIRYSLRSFGIHTDGVIVSDGEANAKPKLFQEYLENRRNYERQQQQERVAEEARTGILAYPSRNSVLIGRGRPYQDFAGNQNFKELCMSQMERYRACDHLFEKTIVLNEFMKTVHDSGGHFLKRVETGWEIADDELAKEKIRKVFRRKPAGGEASGSSSRSAKRLKVNPTAGSEQT